MSKFFSEFLKSGTILTTTKGRILVGYGKKKWLKRPSREEIPSFYFPDFFLQTATPWFTHAHYFEMALGDLLDLLEGEETEQKHRLSWHSPYRKQFENAFGELQQLFNEKALQKAVPFIFELAQTEMNGSLLANSIRHAVRYAMAQPVYLYGFWENDEGILGATPEMLFSTNKDEKATLHTIACAGTRPNNSDELSFLNDPKERHEHQVVVDGIRESLSPYGEVFAGSLQVLRMANLSHLITPMELHLHCDFNFDTIVKALHPTPALGAFPRKEGLQWVRHYQKQIDRKRFGAPVGYTRGNETRCFVAIRNAQWYRDDANQPLIAIGAGCGVVQASIMEKEWKEITLKANATKDILGL